MFALCSELGMLPSEVEGADPGERSFLYAALRERNRRQKRAMKRGGP